MKGTPLGYHVMTRLQDGRVIAPTAGERRVLACTVLEKARGHKLLAFSAADTHLHLEVAEDQHTTNELARRVEMSLHWRLKLEVGFTRAFPKPILDQRHLANAFDYILRQNSRHGLDWDPYHEASNLPDLLGLRIQGQYTATHVRRMLPRVSRRQLLGYLEVDELTPSDEPLCEIIPAAMAATGLVEVQRRTRVLTSIRRAVVEIVGSRLPVSEVARLIGVNRRNVLRLRGQLADPQLVDAIRLQLALRKIRREQDGAFSPSKKCTGEAAG